MVTWSQGKPPTKKQIARKGGSSMPQAPPKLSREQENKLFEDYRG